MSGLKEQQHVVRDLQRASRMSRGIIELNKAESVGKLLRYQLQIDLKTLTIRLQ